MSSKRAKHRKALREIAISNLKKDRNFFVVGLTYGCRKSWKRILGTPALSCILCNLLVTAEVSRISPVTDDGNMYFDFGI